MKLAETEELRSYLAAIVDSSDDAIIGKNLNGIITAWNYAAERMFGYSAQEAIGSPISMLAPPGTVDEMPTILKQIRHGKRVAHYETVRRRKDGTEIPVSLTVSPIRDAGGHIVGASKIVRDISERKLYIHELERVHTELKQRAEQLESEIAERKRAEQALLEAHTLLEARVLERTAKLAETNRELAKKNEEVEAFVYIVSHDLRTPLVNVQGFCKELELSCLELRDQFAALQLDEVHKPRIQEILSEDIPSSLHYISSGTVKFHTLIDALLTLSRYGRQEYSLEPVDLNSLVDSNLQSLAAAIANGGIDFSVRRMPKVRGDARALDEVFSKLLENAIRYRDIHRPGRVEIGAEIANSNFSNSPMVHCWVRDNGIGFPAGAAARVFQVFQRFHPGMADGQGIGLAIAKRIVERHGGRIWAESEEGIGSTFHFTLSPAPVDQE